MCVYLVIRAKVARKVGRPPLGYLLDLHPQHAQPQRTIRIHLTSCIGR